MSIEHITKRSRNKGLQYHTPDKRVGYFKDKGTIIVVNWRVGITAASHDGSLDVFSERYTLRMRKI